MCADGGKKDAHFLREHMSQRRGIILLLAKRTSDVCLNCNEAPTRREQCTHSQACISSVNSNARIICVSATPIQAQLPTTFRSVKGQAFHLDNHKAIPTGYYSHSSVFFLQSGSNKIHMQENFTPNHHWIDESVVWKVLVIRPKCPLLCLLGALHHRTGARSSLLTHTRHSSLFEVQVFRLIGDFSGVNTTKSVDVFA